MVETLRHTILILTLSWLITGCESQDPEITLPGNAMEFDIADLSRTTVTSTHNITEAPFIVFGEMTFMENGNRTVIFNGSPVTFDPSTDKWTYTGTPQYWFPQHDHSFVALYPANPTCISPLQYSDSHLQFTYTQPSEYNKATDMLIATHRRKYIEGNADAVHFSFGHILSNLSINVSYVAPDVADPYIKLTGLTFKNIPTSATYGITPEPLTGNSDMTSYCNFDEGSFYGWTIKDRDDLKIEFPENGQDAKKIPANNPPYPLFSTDDTLLLVPNPGTNTEMEVSYTLYEQFGSESHPETATVSIPKAWKPGLTYILSLTIDKTKNKVKFSVEVAEWQRTEPVIDTTVPRK